MINIEKIQEVVDDVNFYWEDKELKANLGKDGEREIRSIPEFTTIFSMLVEVLFKINLLLEQTNKGNRNVRD